MPPLRCFCSLISILLFGLCHPALAAPYTLPDSETWNLPRSANGRDYAVYVWVPASYKNSPQRTYPVLYCTDGYWNFTRLQSQVSALAWDQAIPECIVVGIGYQGANPDLDNLRVWDLSPRVDRSFDPLSQKSGHADEFLSVIEKEIIPYVQGRYRVDASSRVLAGGSFGGLFTAHVLLERPGLFNGWIIESPSLWWRNNELVSKAATFVKANPSLNAHIYITWASDEYPEIQTTAKGFYETFKKAGIKSLQVAGREIIGEGHGGTASEAFNRGLRYVFKDYPGVLSSRKDPGFLSPSPLINLSTRGWVEGGEKSLIAGFVIRGFEPKTLLVRGVGPSLVNFGVNSVLENPKLRILNQSGGEVASSEDWGSATNFQEIVTTQLKVGAFGLPYSSKDAVLLVTLNPGTYTAVVESANAGTGVALVEVYEVTP